MNLADIFYVVAVIWMGLQIIVLLAILGLVFWIKSQIVETRHKLESSVQSFVDTKKADLAKLVGVGVGSYMVNSLRSKLMFWKH